MTPERRFFDIKTNFEGILITIDSHAKPDARVNEAR